jgi:hypothetical protein
MNLEEVLFERDALIDQLQATTLDRDAASKRILESESELKRLRNVLSMDKVIDVTED